MRISSPRLAAALLVALASSPAIATEYQKEFDKKIKASQDVGVLGDNIAGDLVNFYTASTRFRTTDISVPTNAFPVSLTRTYAVEYERQEASVKGSVAQGETEVHSTRLRAFGDWDLDIPHISTTMTQSGGWIVDSTTSLNRCSVIGQVNAGGTAATGAPPVAMGTKNWTFDPGTYWSGYTLHTESGVQSVLLASLANNERPSAGGPFHWTTNQDWWLSCLTSTANSAGGEGYVAHAPDGKKYTFNWLSKRPVNSTTDSNQTDMWGGGATHTSYVFKHEYLMLPTRIEDRFGNWMTYTWSSDAFARLTSVSAGPVGSTTPEQTLTLSYNAAGFVSSVSDGTRTWQYTYTGSSLSQVTLPDASTWQYSFGALNAIQPRVPNCSVDASLPENYWICFGGGEIGQAPVDAYVIHPAGARVDFQFDHHYQFTSSTTSMYPLGLSQKSISGPGLTAATWKFGIYPSKDQAKAMCQTGTCPARVMSDQLNPDNSLTRRIFGVVLSQDETVLLGELQGSTAANSGGSPAITTSVRWGADILDDTSPLTGTVPVFYKEWDYRHAPSTQTMPYVVKVGANPLGSVYFNEIQIYASERRLPVVTRNLVQQGVTFTSNVTDFDVYANPTATTKASTGGSAGNFSKVEKNAYITNAAKWVLGQPGTTWVSIPSALDKEVSRTEYDATTAMPLRTYGYTLLQETRTYNGDGTLSTVKDGRNNVTTLTDWYRGIPRVIYFPGNQNQQATVSPLGSVLTTTNELGSTMTYGYDVMGRLNNTLYPTGDTLAWSPTGRAFTRVTSSEYGLDAGHWKLVVTTGGERHTTYYDGHWRPVIQLEESTGTLPFAAFTVKRYDALGREVFTSYPVFALNRFDDTLAGTTTSYDALGRAKQVTQTAEAGVGNSISTATEYLSGFQTKVATGRGYYAVTGYQVFDQASDERIASVTLPEGITTTITRQPTLGKPLEVTRGGTYAGAAVSATRIYVYDDYERLCKAINPESGATLMDYDAAGNIAWSADGTSQTGNVCDRGSVIAGQKTTRIYDPMNRVSAVATPGGLADVTTTYHADGLVSTLTAANPGGNNVVTSYVYNKRRLLTSETSTNGTPQLTLGYGYKFNGYLKEITYPDMHVVSFNPDALGRASAITGTGGVTYASGIHYYANGAIKDFTYGNGIVHTMDQNARLLPTRSLDKHPSLASVLDDTYSFDANGNVLGIVDQAQSGLTTRSMSYDGLDRMITANSAGQWGNASYAYDPMDNVRLADQGARQYRYNYDAVTKRLVDIKSPSGTTLHNFGYDVQGNVTAKNSQGLVFDSANRLNQVTGVQTYRYDGKGRRVQTTDSNGTLSYWMYSQAGQVLHTSEGRRSQNLNYIYLGNTQVATRAVTWGTGAVTTRFQHTDALGSIVAETDSGATAVKRNAYAPYGEAFAGTTIDGTGFTGHVMDLATGLTYMQQRYYDPQVGRFLSVDSIASTVTTENFGRYTYAANNPYKFTDPDGRQIMLQWHLVDVGTEVPAYHTFLTIKPDNQAAYSSSNVFVNVDNQGKRYATVGAGNEGRMTQDLVAGVNRDKDRVEHTGGIEIQVPRQYKNEDAFIAAIFTAVKNFQVSSAKNPVDYDFNPKALEKDRSMLVADDGYNSNSFTSGLLEKVGAKVPKVYDAPGWDRPAPVVRFDQP